MSEQNEVIEQNDVQDKYLETIKELKERMDNEMISKEEYDKLLKENEKLLKDYINRRPAPVKTEPKELRSASEIAKQLSAIKDGDVTNREYWEISLEYRDAMMKEYGKDPWTDGMGEPTNKTKIIANTVKQLLDEYPNPVSFRTQFNEILNDDPAVIQALRSRNKKK